MLLVIVTFLLTTATYAGLRAATEQRDYQIRLHADHRYVTVGGIRSTGLTSAMAVAEYEGLAGEPRQLETGGNLRTARLGGCGSPESAFPDRVQVKPFRMRNRSLIPLPGAC